MVHDQKGHSLLIVDDDDAFRWSLRELLEPRGYRTILASTGPEAITLVEQHPIDCLLMDVQMPELSGLETLQIVRQVRAVLPCILLTANGTPGVIEQAMSLRAYTVLIKPVRGDVVASTVRAAIETAARPA